MQDVPCIGHPRCRLILHLSSTEAEYIAISQSMREVIPIMWLLQEASDHGIDNNKEFIYCYLTIGEPKSTFAVLHLKIQPGQSNIMEP